MTISTTTTTNNPEERSRGVSSPEDRASEAAAGAIAASQSGVQIPDRLYFKIGDVADLVGVKPYVLRYWESEFPILAPEKKTTGQRVYRKSDVETLLMIKHLLYVERYSIEGARRRIRELRKGGALRSFKKEKVAEQLSSSRQVPAEGAVTAAPESLLETRVESAAASLSASPERLVLIRKAALELKLLAEAPITDLFRD